MNDTTKLITAFAAGALAGAIAGVLLAPDKGSETRKKLSEQGKKMANSLKEKLRSGKEKFNDLKEGLRQNAEEEIEEFT